ncbi:DUF4139 domain-containing protein [Sphingobacterium corticibacterium]|uniref:Mucoidy inhibitor MuiA family protein n=1 Tax=Sphingobacterium corticibacterium TaxID=2484746 RepID=A0A4Q6XUQ9_9SPHI|nr:DUF4139 domain-containing protein [Sphingobacterium corticibacterium]RZF61382.1 mucoidy inhibitor MuiA family protein [Sphingobacterium corticibacterium]
MMTKSSLLFSIGLVLVNLSFAQKAIIQKAELKNVTVFTNAAELNHTANINLPTGSSEIVFTHVANSIDENSIQIGTGSQVTILSVRPALNYMDADVKTTAYSQVENEYKRALTALKQLQNQKATEESLLKLLEQNQKISGDNSSTTVAELTKMAEFYKPKYLEVKNNITALEEKIAEQQDVVDKAKVQFDEVKGQTSGSGGQLIVQIMNKQTGNQPFTISYLTRQANWNASYELRTENTASPLQIVYKANVSQQTGVDWQQVNLRLSTSNPSQGGVAPTLSPWHLYYYEISGQNMLDEVVTVANGSTRKLNIVGAARQEAAAAPQALNDYVQQVENQLNTTFDIDIPYTIVSNGKQHAVSLKEYTHPASYQYYVAPRINQEVFLLAEMTDYEKLNLIPGQANVMFENMLVGKTYINPIDATDTLKLSLGRDKMISVKREKINDLSSSRLIGNSRTQTTIYEITIKNNKKSAVSLTLQEQYPLSTDKSMDITLEESNGGEVNRETGIVTWKLNIPAGGTQKLKFGYSVKHPKDKRVNLF